MKHSIEICVITPDLIVSDFKQVRRFDNNY